MPCVKFEKLTLTNSKKRTARDRGPSRLKLLYEISKLFTWYENVESTVFAALSLVGRVISLRTAVLVVEWGGHARTVAWRARGQESSALAAASVEAWAAYGSLVGRRSLPTALVNTAESRAELLPEWPRKSSRENGCQAVPVLIPFAVGRQPVFGGVCVTGRRPLAERDLEFVNEFVSQLAIALDRHLTHEREVARRQRAEILEQQHLASLAVAEAAVRGADDFVAMMSHELRNPLQATVGWIRLLRMDGVDAEMLHRGLEAIERATMVQARLVSDILDVARINSGSVRIEARRIDVASLITEAIEISRPAAIAKNIRLEVAFRSPSEFVVGDAERLQQVICNLLSNAIKFTPREGSVTVDLDRVDGEVEIRVADTGQGISADLLPRVFDRYRQGNTGPTKRQSGLGLGLAIVKHLVELHGGDVRAESPGDGRGATITVRLPVPVRQSRRAVPLTERHSEVATVASAV